MRVNTLARTMSPTLREARVGTSLVLPSATRAATSASDRPAAMLMRHRVKVPILSCVEVLQRQLVAVERRRGNASGRSVFGDEARR